MKFSNGYWLLRDGVQAAHPVEVYDLTAGDGRIVVHAPTHRIRHRGDLLKGPVATVGFSSPMPDVIGVSVTHFEGGLLREPRFELATVDEEAKVSEDGHTLTAGALSVRLHRGDGWKVDFLADGKTLTTSGAKGMGFMSLDGEHHVRDQLDLSVGTQVYGLGERSGPWCATGRSSTSGTPTPARAANRPTRTSRSI